MNYTVIIGLEIHCELLTESKIFCSCKNEFGGDANTRVCPICCGMPGTLPSLNKKAVYLAAKAGLATDCTINNYSTFDRKNYFYPDLPKAFQITQFYHPLCSDGFIELENKKRIRINRIHVEEDAGKLVHDNSHSLIDYNRCGVPLIEIVTEPDFRTTDEVVEFVKQISLRLKHSDVCDGKMEQGSLRVDVNISLTAPDSPTYGTRTEIKNLNSTKAIAKAIEAEAQRQARLLDSGKKIIQETRRYREKQNDTISMRAKEGLLDYRYFPEPDIPPVFLSDKEINNIRKSMSELPHLRKKRYITEHGLSYDDAELISTRKDLSVFYEKAVSIIPEYRLISNLILGEICKCINDSGLTLDASKITSENVSEIAILIRDRKISNNAAKEIINILFYDGGNPISIAKKHNLIMMDNSKELNLTISAVLRENEALVAQYKNGEEKLFGYIMGQIMHKCGKQANPALVRQILEQKLKEM